MPDTPEKKWIRRKILCDIYGMSSSTLDRRMAKRGFPRPYRHGGVIVWKVEEVDAWFASKPKET